MIRNEDLSFERDQQVVYITNSLLNKKTDIYDMSLILTLDELPYLLKVSKKLIKETPHIVKREFVGNNVAGIGDVKAYLSDETFEWEEFKFSYSKKNLSHGGGGVKLTQSFSKNIIPFNQFDQQYYLQYNRELKVTTKKEYHKEWRKRRNLITEKYNLNPRVDGSKISKMMYKEYPETNNIKELFSKVKKEYSTYLAKELSKLPIEQVYRVSMGIMKGLRKVKDLNNFTLENSKYILREVNIGYMNSPQLKVKINEFKPKKSITKIIPNSQQLEIHFCDKSKLSFPLSHGNGGQGSLETYTLKVFFEA